jgi:hypothetical protein
MDEQSFCELLPCPQPLPQAVLAGEFGFTEAGPLCPDAEDVRAMTEEHAREMIGLLADVRHLRWCQAYAREPATGRPPRPRRAAGLARRLEREIAHFASRYEDCLAVFAGAFGDRATETLDAAVRKFVEYNLPQEVPQIQRQLF